MPRAKQLTVSAPDRAGLLGELASALGAKKVNIRAMHAWGQEGTGHIRIVVDKHAAAKKELAARGWETSEDDVLMVTLSDAPGTLGRLGNKLGKAGVNIRYAYVGMAGSARRANVYLGVSDIKAALKAAR
jgi:hypothetical protein